MSVYKSSVPEYGSAQVLLCAQSSFVVCCHSLLWQCSSIVVCSVPVVLKFCCVLSPSCGNMHKFCCVETQSKRMADCVPLPSHTLLLLLQQMCSACRLNQVAVLLPHERRWCRQHNTAATAVSTSITTLAASRQKCRQPVSRPNFVHTHAPFKLKQRTRQLLLGWPRCFLLDATCAKSLAQHTHDILHRHTLYRQQWRQQVSGV
jgi:hypothetical protein